MFGALLGIVCGCAEFYLLKRLVDGATAGKIVIWVIPAKMFVLAACFVPCALFLRTEIVYCGIAAAASLIGCTAALMIARRVKGTKGEEKSA